MKNIHCLSKKKNYITTLWELSRFFKGLMIAIGITVVSVINYFLSLWELNHFDRLKHFLDKSMETNGSFILDVFLTMITNTIFIAVIVFIFERIIPWIVSSISRMKAIYRYCYIPLTEEEVRNKGFSSANDYFLFVKDLITYKDWYEVDGKDYLYLKDNDLYEMVVVCMKVFHDKKGIFSLDNDAMVVLSPCNDFRLFIKEYNDHEKTSEQKIYYDENGNIILSYKCEKTEITGVIKNCNIE